MKVELNKEELNNINGGAWKLGVIGAIIAGGVFIIGVVDGFLRPYACRRQGGNMSNQELIMVRGGGFMVSSTYLNSLARVINSVLELGRTFGTSIRMFISGKKC